MNYSRNLDSQFASIGSYENDPDQRPILLHTDAPPTSLTSHI